MQLKKILESMSPSLRVEIHADISAQLINQSAYIYARAEISWSADT